MKKCVDRMVFFFEIKRADNTLQLSASYIPVYSRQLLWVNSSIVDSDIVDEAVPVCSKLYVLATARVETIIRILKAVLCVFS